MKRTFNPNAGETELGKMLLGLPYPPCRKVIQKFKIILIPKAVINMADRIPVNDKGMNIALVDSTEEYPEKTMLGLNINYLRRTWNQIKKISISAGTAERKPYQLEKQLFKPFQKFMDSQVERFLDEFIIDKMIALHLGKGFSKVLDN